MGWKRWRSDVVPAGRVAQGAALGGGEIAPTHVKIPFSAGNICVPMQRPGRPWGMQEWGQLGYFGVFLSSGSGVYSASSLIRTQSIYPALNSTTQPNVRSIFISCYPPFYLISIEQDIFIPSSAPAWIFISNSDSRLSSRRPNCGSCCAGMQPRGEGFVQFLWRCFTFL